MKIIAIKPFVLSAGIFIKVETNAGIYGIGEAGMSLRGPAVAEVLNMMAPILVGEDPRRIEHLWQVMYRGGFFPGGGIQSAAVSAVDIALWDILGKALDVPVYQLLGGHVRDRIRVYCGVYTAPETDEAVRQVMARHEEFGFTCFKLSPYRTNLHEGRWGDMCATAGKWFGEMRAKLPSHFELAFDAHARIDEPIKALQLAEALAPHDPYFFEEPLRPEHMPAWGRLRAQMTVPLATGEIGAPLTGRCVVAEWIAHDEIVGARQPRGLLDGARRRTRSPHRRRRWCKRRRHRSRGRR